MAFRTVVDLNRGGIDITEYTIESWLFERPDLIEGEGLNPVAKWIGRQYKLPSGVADLLGIQRNGNFSLIEVKERRIQRSAIWQILRYAEGLKSILGRGSYSCANRSAIDLILVGRGINWDILEEAESANIKVFSYDLLNQGSLYTGLTLQALWPEGILSHE